MKILQVNCVYKKGSTGKIVYDLHTKLLDSGFESVVCYGRGNKTNEENVYKICGEFYSHLNKVCSMLTGLLYGGCFFSTNKLIRIIKKENPSIVHLQCINGDFVNIYRLITWLKKNNIKTVLTLHAEFMYTANCGHSLECNQWIDGCKKCPRLKKDIKSLIFDRTAKSWKKMKKAFDGFSNLYIVSVSPWLKDRAKQSQILKDKNHFVVYNGLNSNIFRLNQDLELKKKLCQNNEKIVFHATPNFTDDKENLKGGYYVIELAKKMINENIKFIVAGNYKENIVVPSNVVLLGNVKDQTLLAKYYSIADVTLLTSKKETFSMVTAESLSCGTPVVGFMAGGPEQIALKDYSTFVEYGDIGKLEKSVENILSQNIDRKDVEQKAQIYSSESMTKSYISLYMKMVNEK